MEKLNLKMAASAIATNMDEAMVAADKIGAFPLIIRPAFTLGGTGGGIAYNMDEFKEIVNAGLTASMTTQARCALVCVRVFQGGGQALPSVVSLVSMPGDSADSFLA